MALIDAPSTVSGSPERETFGSFLRALRGEKSQVDVAAAASINQTYLSQIERGRRPAPTGDLLARLIAAVGAGGEDATRLRSLSERAHQAPPTIELVSVAEDRERQESAREVWVVSDAPLESFDNQYLALVIDGITAPEPRSYVYWSSRLQVLDTLWLKINQAVVSRVSDDSSKVARALSSVTFIHAPPSATWFSFSLYDPRDAYQAIGMLSVELATRPSGYVAELTDYKAFARILEHLRLVFDQVTLSRSESSAAIEWKRHVPPGQEPP